MTNIVATNPGAFFSMGASLGDAVTEWRDRQDKKRQELLAQQAADAGITALLGSGNASPVAPQSPFMPGAAPQPVAPSPTPGSAGVAFPMSAGTGPKVSYSDPVKAPFAKMAFDRAIAAGYSPQAASALVGNAFAESRFNPTLTHDGGTGVGIYGFRDPTPGQGRKTALMRFAQANGRDWRDPMTQFDFALHELNTTEGQAGAAFRSARTLQDAQNAAVGFLRPQGYTAANPGGAHNYAGRLAYSGAVLNAFGGGAGQQPSATPPQYAPGSPAAALISNGVPQNQVEAIRAMARNPTTRAQAFALAAQLAKKVDPQDAALKSAQLESTQLGNAKARRDLAAVEMERVTAPDGTVFERPKTGGQWTATLQLGQKPADPTTDERNYKAAQAGGYTGTFVEYQTSLKKSGATNVNVGGGSDKQIFDALEESAKAASAAQTGLQAIGEARRAVESGGYFGAGADVRLGLAKIAAAFGADPTKVVNTETFRSAIAPQVAAIMKATVGSTQISNADREFAEKAGGGSITLDPSSISRLLGIMERAGNAVIAMHQKKLDAVYPENGSFARERTLFSIGGARPAAQGQPAPQQASPPVQGARQANDGHWYVPDPSRPGKYLMVQ